MTKKCYSFSDLHLTKLDKELRRYYYYWTILWGEEQGDSDLNYE